LAVVAIAALGAAATAFPPYLEKFVSTYTLKAGTPLASAKCATCHVGPSGGARNPFGKAITAERKKADTSDLTEAILKGLEPADSDGDGAPNLKEIEAGTLPGDPASKPASVDAPTTGAPAPTPQADLVPKHSLHPLIVHFPIGLFLFGVLLEVLGMRKKNEALRQAAFWNLAGGALTGLASVPTGFIAALRIPYELTPGTPVFNHLIGGVLATILMVIVVAWRRKSAPETGAYLTTLLLAAALVVAAGHYGGALVYG
jgi:uncharacterized membrane protein